MPETITPTVDSAIEEALATPPKVEEKVAEVKAEKEPVEDSVSEEELTNARNIAKILKDPEQTKNFIEYLAKQAGLIKDESGASKKEVVEATVDELESALEDYPELRGKLVPALKKAIEKELEPVKAALNNAKKEQVSRELDAAWDSLVESTEGDFSKYEKEVVNLMDEVPYEKGSYKTYLKRLYTLASADDSTAAKKAKVVEKINNTAKGAKIASGETDPEKIEAGSKFPTIEEAIQLAAQGKKI